MPGLKAQLRRLLASDDDLRLWAAVGIAREAQDVELWLRPANAAGQLENVSQRLTIASLRPLRFVMGSVSSEPLPRIAISIREASTRRLIGCIDCDRDDTLSIPRASGLQLYRPLHSRVHLPPARRWAVAAVRSYSRWRNHRQKDPFNFEMKGPDLRALLLFYVRPRPVVLVSVAHDGCSNLFPMDLIGPVSPRQFTFALRTTSPAVRLIRESRRVSLADVPIERVATAYELGKHHRKENIEWESLPFSTFQAPRFGLRLPDFALRVREMEVMAAHEVGSHTLFVGECVFSEQRAAGAQLHHTAGFYQAFRRRRGIAFSEAPA